jgi:hypothetical protein
LAQVAEHLSSKYEVLSSNPVPPKQSEKKEKEEIRKRNKGSEFDQSAYYIHVHA